MEDCVQERDPGLQINACTAVIRSGELEPANLAVAHNNRGLAYLNLGAPRLAIPDFDQALQLKPRHAVAFNNRCWAKNEVGRYDRAIEDCSQALRVDPSYAPAYSNRAMAHVGLGELRRSIEDLNRALELDPDFPTAFYNRGLAYSDLGEFRRAIQDFHQVLRLEAADADLFIERGVAYLNLGEFHRAIRDFDQAIRLDPEIAGAYFGRGEAYSNLGEYPRAVEEYEEALRLDPGYEIAEQGRAFALRQMGRGDQARSRSGGSPDRDTIIAAQRMLAELGLYEDAIDGIAGPNTLRAVRAFQEAWGYPTTGVVDERLLGRLDVVTTATAAVAEEEEAAAEDDARVEPPPEEAASLEVSSAGSGFFVTEDGWILTNRHVVEGCVETHAVVAGNRMGTTRQIISFASDLALVKAGYAPPSVARFRAGKGIRPGETIVAIGFPLVWLLSPEPNVTTGNVSALAGIRGDATELQHTAPIQPGNSGGPLLDDSGNVVGVMVAKADAIEIAKATGDIPENIGFAIKASVARDFLDAEGLDYRMAPSDARQDIADLAVQARPYVALVPCLR